MKLLSMSFILLFASFTFAATNDQIVIVKGGTTSMTCSSSQDLKFYSAKEFWYGVESSFSLSLQWTVEVNQMCLKKITYYPSQGRSYGCFLNSAAIPLEDYLNNRNNRAQQQQQCQQQQTAQQQVPTEYIVNVCGTSLKAMLKKVTQDLWFSTKDCMLNAAKTNFEYSIDN